MNPQHLGALLALLTLAGTAGAYERIRDINIGKNPVRGTVQERVALPANGRVEVREIDGSVEVVGGDGAEVRIEYQRAASTQAEYDCETLRHERSGNTLRLHVEHHGGPGCRLIHVTDHLRLVVPRGAALKVSEVGENVQVEGVRGMVELDAIGDSALLKDLTRLKARAIGDSLRLQLAGLDKDGVDISSVGDSVDVQLPRQVDAQLQVEGVGDQINAKALGVDVTINTDEDEVLQHLSVVLGRGGAPLRIRGVGDSVTLRRS